MTARGTSVRGTGCSNAARRRLTTCHSPCLVDCDRLRVRDDRPDSSCRRRVGDIVGEDERAADNAPSPEVGARLCERQPWIVVAMWAVEAPDFAALRGLVQTIVVARGAKVASACLAHKSMHIMTNTVLTAYLGMPNNLYRSHASDVFSTKRTSNAPCGHPATNE